MLLLVVLLLHVFLCVPCVPCVPLYWVFAGETHFPEIAGGLKVAPKKGSVALWSNVHPNDHEVTPKP